ncbi:MAG: hypothetical protein HDT26_13900 [Subdoligranulum sp.]|nr:hypothetical protein [Subdoligranulum sp.]
MAFSGAARRAEETFPRPADGRSPGGKANITAIFARFGADVPRKSIFKEAEISSQFIWQKYP